MRGVSALRLIGSLRVRGLWAHPRSNCNGEQRFSIDFARSCVWICYVQQVDVLCRPFVRPAADIGSSGDLKTLNPQSSGRLSHTYMRSRWVLSLRSLTKNRWESTARFAAFPPETPSLQRWR